MDAGEARRGEGEGELGVVSVATQADLCSAPPILTLLNASRTNPPRCPDAHARVVALALVGLRVEVSVG